MNLTDAKRVVDHALNAGETVIVVGHCHVHYQGRAASKLSEGDRVLFIKKDGTFLVHQSKGMTAINYQGPGSQTATLLGRDETKKEVFTCMSSRKAKASQPREQITVHFSRVDFAQSFPLTDDSKLKVSGTEEDLSGLLMQDLDVVEKGLKPLQQESANIKGHIDILAEDAKGNLVVIEVKRRTAELAAVTQLRRYVEEISKRKGRTVRGILVAPGITENAKTMLDGWNLEFAKLDFEMHGMDANINHLEKKQKTMVEF